MRSNVTIILMACLLVFCICSLGVLEKVRAFQRDIDINEAVKASDENKADESPSKYQKKKINLSMAGSGDPWKALTKKRRYILRALHDGLSLQSLAEAFSLSVEQIISEIKPMQEASLVEELNKSYAPTFFISDRKETEKVFAHSKKTGKTLAKALISRWDKLEQSYSRLSLSRSHSFKELAFMLVGSRILDIGLLGALVKDKSFLVPAPSRPSPERPDARYYFWMVEGELEHLGRYGQDDMTLPQTNWHLLTFGQSWVKGISNFARNALELKYEKIIKSYKGKGPELLAKELNIPLLTKEDSMIWANTAEQFSNILLRKLKEQSATLEQFFNTLKASRYAHDSYGDFICWYVHIAFAWAIDVLQEKDAMTIPSELFSAIILYREGSEGVLY